MSSQEETGNARVMVYCACEKSWKHGRGVKQSEGMMEAMGTYSNGVRVHVDES